MFRTFVLLRLLLLTLVVSWILPGTAVAKEKRSPLVVVSEAQTGEVIRQVPLSGTVSAVRDARLSSEVRGQVKTVRVEVGDEVEAGTPLLELDREVEELTLERLQAATQQSQVALADALRRYDDAKRLRKQNSISENELRLAETEVNVNRAILRQRQAEEKLQQARVDRHTLRAPFSGVITERLTESGEWIEPGDAVLNLVAVDRLRIEFHVPQEYYSAIDDASTLDITLDALPKSQFRANIDVIVPYSDPDSRTFVLHATIDTGKDRITPGMSVHGKLNLDTGSDGVVISRDAILRYPDGRVTVWVIEPGSEPPVVTEKRVVTGKGFKGLVPVREGLDAGDVVVVEGNESLKEGQQVQIHQPK
jgi:RND family efflux transporter MFP subunit